MNRSKLDRPKFSTRLAVAAMFVGLAVDAMGEKYTSGLLVLGEIAEDLARDEVYNHEPSCRNCHYCMDLGDVKDGKKVYCKKFWAWTREKRATDCREYEGASDHEKTDNETHLG